MDRSAQGRKVGLAFGLGKPIARLASRSVLGVATACFRVHGVGLRVEATRLDSGLEGVEPGRQVRFPAIQGLLEIKDTHRPRTLR